MKRKPTKSRVDLRKMTLTVKDLSEVKYLGLAYQKDRKIEIHSGQNSQEFLDTTLHECLHLMLPDLSEMRVIKMANKLSSILWRLNYRRIMK